MAVHARRDTICRVFCLSNRPLTGEGREGEGEGEFDVDVEFGVRVGFDVLWLGRWLGRWLWLWCWCRVWRWRLVLVLD